MDFDIRPRRDELPHERQPLVGVEEVALVAVDGDDDENALENRPGAFDYIKMPEGRRIERSRKYGLYHAGTINRSWAGVKATFSRSLVALARLLRSAGLRDSMARRAITVYHASP